MQQNDLKEVLRNWLEISSVVQIDLVPGGATHKTYKVVTNGFNCYLRAYKYSDELRIQREHSLLEKLEDTDIPAVKLIYTHNNSTYVLFNGQYFALYEAVEGVQITKSNFGISHIEEAAKTLANFHLVSKNFSVNFPSPQKLEWNGNLWVKRFNQIVDGIESLGRLNDSDKRILIRAKAQQEWLRSPECNHHYQFLYSGQLTHGDYHQHNIFFNDSNKVSGIIDWDTAIILPRAYEILRACSFMLDMDVDKCSVFISAYRDVSQIDVEELEDGANGWGCYSDHHVWPLEEAFIHHNASATKFIPTREFRPFKEEWLELKNALL